MSPVIRGRLVFLGCVLVVWALGNVAPGSLSAQEAAAPPPPPAIPDHVYAAKLDDVWEAALTFLKTRPLPIPVANADKEKGVIATTPQRYMKIASASFPPREQDYRDTYTLTFTALPKGPPPKTPPVPGVAPLPPDKPVDLTKLQIERKFEKYDKKAKAWVDTDPSKEHAGVSVQDIFQGVQLQLTPPPPAAAIEE